MTREPEALADTDVLTLSLLEVEREGEIALLISVLLPRARSFFEEVVLYYILFYNSFDSMFVEILTYS